MSAIEQQLQKCAAKCAEAYARVFGHLPSTHGLGSLMQHYYHLSVLKKHGRKSDCFKCGAKMEPNGAFCDKCHVRGTDD